MFVVSVAFELFHNYLWVCGNIPGKFRNVVLEEDGEDQLDRSREK